MARTSTKTKTGRHASRTIDSRWIGQRLAAARQHRGWDVDQLAQRARLSRRRVERCEATGDLTCDELAALAIALRLPIDHFLGPCVLCHAVVPHVQ